MYRETTASPSTTDRTSGRGRILAVVLSAAVIAAACGGDDRPSGPSWAADWQRERALVPSVDELTAGGRALCDELVGVLRGNHTRLTPTPTEALDDAVMAWTDHADSLVFDCPTDAAELAERMGRLDVLAAEIDAGLVAGG